MTDRQPTCADRIADHLASREAAMTELVDRQNGADEEDAEQAREEVWELALAISTVRTLRVDLSTGGPADYLTVEIEKGRYGWEIAGEVAYHFADWFDHAETRVPERSALWNYVSDIVEMFDDEADR